MIICTRRFSRLYLYSSFLLLNQYIIKKIIVVMCMRSREEYAEPWKLLGTDGASAVLSHVLNVTDFPKTSPYLLSLLVFPHSSSDLANIFHAPTRVTRLHLAHSTTILPFASQTSLSILPRFVCRFSHLIILLIYIPSPFQSSESNISTFQEHIEPIQLLYTP
jgi:hypothetical protein